MKDPAEQIILLLAASGLSEPDIHRALRTLDRLGPSKTTDIVYTVRQRIRSLDFVPLRRSESSSVGPSVSEDITRLLLEEAGLPSAEAGRRLYASIEGSIGKKIPIPAFRSKEGLRSWVLQLVRRVPASEILHHATRVRNEAVHRGRKSDWPLRDRET